MIVCLNRWRIPRVGLAPPMRNGKPAQPADWHAAQEGTFLTPRQQSDLREYGLSAAGVATEIPVRPLPARFAKMKGLPAL